MRYVPGRVLMIALALIAPRAAAADPKEWEVEGRPLPEPLLLQPRLDEALGEYRSSPAIELAGRLEGSAPAILPKLVDRWIAAFRAHHPRAQVTVPPPYLAPQGVLSPPLQRFLEGGLDFAFLSRDLTPEDVATFRRTHGAEPVAIPVAAGSYAHFGFVDAVAIVVHKDNPIERLTYSQVDALFSRTRHRRGVRVNTWGDLGVTQWESLPIHVVGAASWRGGESARAAVIRERILSVEGRRGEWRDDLDAAQGSEAQVPELVAADRHAIGFTGMGHLLPSTRAVALAPEARGPSYQASYENVARALYPMSRVVHVIVAKRSGQALDPTLEAFVRFLVSKEGQRIVADQGVFLPLRADQARVALRLLGEIAR